MYLGEWSLLPFSRDSSLVWSILSEMPIGDELLLWEWLLRCEILLPGDWITWMPDRLVWSSVSSGCVGGSWVCGGGWATTGWCTIAEEELFPLLMSKPSELLLVLAKRLIILLVLGSDGLFNVDNRPGLLMQLVVPKWVSPASTIELTTWAVDAEEVSIEWELSPWLRLKTLSFGLIR